MEVGDLPPAGGRPRFGLGLGNGGALAILVTMSLRALRISAVSVGGPVGEGGSRSSGLWASVGACRVGELVAITTHFTLDFRILAATSVSVDGSGGAVARGTSRAWVRLGIVGAGVGAK